MANAPGVDKDKAPSEGESLKPREDAQAKVETHPKDNAKVTHSAISEIEKKHRLLAYRPGHKATFIGLAVVILILGINAAVLGFLLKKESANSKALSDKGVSISPGTLSKLGVNDSQIGSSNEKLIVDPAAQFNSQITVAGDVSIGGQLHLNSTLDASNADLSQLQAGNSTVNTINVNGAATATTLSLRNSLAVSGAAQFQNTVTIAQLLSVESSAAVASNLSVGNELSASTVAAGNLVISGITELGGHILTAGRTPAVAGGGALGSYDTIGISGTDEAGTISLGVGANPISTGLVAHITFAAGYSTQPVIVISADGPSYAEFYIGGESTSGFDIYNASTLNGPASYYINFIVEQ